MVNWVGEFDENDLYFGMKLIDIEVVIENLVVKNFYNLNELMMLVVWIKSYEFLGGIVGKVFICIIVVVIDMMNEGVCWLLVNVSYYLLGMEVFEKVFVNIEGIYEFVIYSFFKEGYWENKGLKVIDM